MKIESRILLQRSVGNGDFGQRIEIWAYKLNKSGNLVFSMVNTFSNTV